MAVDLNLFTDKDPNKIVRNLSVTPSSSFVSLNWDLPINSGGISQYNVWRAYTKDLAFQNIGNTISTGYIDSGVDNGKDYYYSITTVYSGFAASAVLIPYNVTASLQTGFTPPNIRLDWQAPLSLFSGNIVNTNIASGTIALYQFEGNVSDSGINNYPLSEVGSLRYSNTVANTQAGKSAAGPFSSNGYATGAKDILSGFSNLNNWTIEFFANPINRTASPKIISWLNENGENYIGLPNTAPESIEFRLSGSVSRINEADVSNTVWSNYALTYDGQNTRLYHDDKLILTTGINGYTGTITGLYVGISTSGTGGAFSGYLDDLRFLNYTKTIFPTQDNVGTSGIPNSTIALYRFESGLQDETGRYPLSSQGNPTYSNSVFKEGSFSIGGFNKTTYLSGTSLSSGLSGLRGAYTIEMYIYINEISTNNQALLTFLSSGFNQNIRVLNTSGLQWQAGGTTLSFPAGTIETGWQHLAFTMDGISRKGYRNGIKKGETSSQISRAFLDDVQNLRIGSDYLEAFPAFSGFIDYLRFSSGTLSGFPTENVNPYSGTSLTSFESPVSGYRVWRSNQWDSAMSPIATTTGLNYIDSGLDTNYPYYYRVTSLF